MAEVVSSYGTVSQHFCSTSMAEVQLIDINFDLFILSFYAIDDSHVYLKSFNFRSVAF